MLSSFQTEPHFEANNDQLFLKGKGLIVFPNWTFLSRPDFSLEIKAVCFFVKKSEIPLKSGLFIWDKLDWKICCWPSPSTIQEALWGLAGCIIVPKGMVAAKRNSSNFLRKLGEKRSLRFRRIVGRTQGSEHGPLTEWELGVGGTDSALGRPLIVPLWAYEVKTCAVESGQQRPRMAQITSRTKGAFRRNGNVISADKQRFHAASMPGRQLDKSERAPI